jgi:titin
VIQGNVVGMDLSGKFPRGNHLDGIVINVTSAPGNDFVGANLIFGNLANGIGILGPASGGNQIEANVIGTNILGTPGIGANGLDGIYIENTTGYQIGGLTPGAGNLISGNGVNGIEIEGPASTNLAVLGNRIGTDFNGKYALGNAQNGVWIRDGASSNVIGGSTPGAGNLISGNGVDGVLFSDLGGFGSATAGNQLFGNKIGTNVDGTAPLVNQTQQRGVLIVGADDNLVGGALPGQGNLISGNLQDGLRLPRQPGPPSRAI